MNKTYIKNNPEAPKNFLRAFRGAYEYYRDNVEQADAWFTEEAGLDITPEALAIAASVEPNLSGEEIRLDFSEDDYIIMEEAVNFLVEQEIMPKYINPRDVINLDYLYSL
jgi:ABC-type nitrate/sulfonate/bicarbonate transport system substrate-binding protein